MKRFILVSFIILIAFNDLSIGQSSNKQIGIRTGLTGGFFYQVTSESGNAEVGYNAMLSFKLNGIQLTGLKIYFETTLDEISSDLYFTWGYGAHAGFVVTDNISFLGEKYYFSGERFCPLIGVDGWIGAEYRFQTLPLNIGINIKPYVELSIPSFIHLMPGDVGISVAYIF
jgi:hypothetical protein